MEIDWLGVASGIVFGLAIFWAAYFMGYVIGQAALRGEGWFDADKVFELRDLRRENRRLRMEMEERNHNEQRQR